MHRRFRVISLSTLAAFLLAVMGCGSEGNVNSSDTSPDAAKEAAAKMPPPPSFGKTKKKK
ncbi:hypothetical protein [Singulisphaera sp. PoT]|uniref:hypothetical protein n=1 Tax=Singulisphaera sp. PoT TaxID=3411797 RepID=UPI003BF59D0E